MRRRRLIMMLSGAFRFLKSIKMIQTGRKANLTQAPGSNIATARQIKTSRSAEIIGFPAEDMIFDGTIDSSHNVVASSHDTTTLSVYRKTSLGKLVNLLSYGIGQLRWNRKIYMSRKANLSGAPGTVARSNRKVVLSVPSELEAARATDVSVNENMLADVKMAISQSLGQSITSDSIVEGVVRVVIDQAPPSVLVVRENQPTAYRAELITCSYPEQIREKLYIRYVYDVTPNGSRLKLT